MCLYINTYFHENNVFGSLHTEQMEYNGANFNQVPKPFVAKTDIHVYKVLEKHHSEYGNTYKTPYMEAPVAFVKYDKGMSISKMLSFGFTFEFDNFFHRYSVKKGIHSYLEQTSLNLLKTTWSHKHAIIPKGTKFYIGTHRDVVSEKLIVFEYQNQYKEYLKENKDVLDVTKGKSYSQMAQILKDTQNDKTE